MTPFLRLSLSLSLTLLVWGPNAMDAFVNGSVNLADLAFRFVVTFAFFRTSVWGLGQLLDSYRSSAPVSKDIISAASPSRTSVPDRRAGRRQSDAEANVVAERELPGLPSAR